MYLKEICMASLAMSVPFLREYAAAAAQACRTSLGAGCQAAGISALM
jgi:hypothetical protein